jgi:hypothetical protein
MLFSFRGGGGGTSSEYGVSFAGGVGGTLEVTEDAVLSM